MLQSGQQATPDKSSVRFLGEQILHYIPGAIVPALIGLATSAIFTRVFAVDEYGRYSLVLGITGVLSTVSGNWIHQGIARYLPGQSGPEAEGLKRAAITAAVLVGVTVAAILSVLKFATGWALSNEWSGLFWPAVWTVVSTIVFMPLSTMLQAEMRARRHTRYQIINVVLRFAVSIVFVFLIRRDIADLLWAAVFSTVILIPVLWRETRLPPAADILKTVAQVRGPMVEMFAYGFPMIGWALAATALHLADRFILGLTRGSAEVGIYSANYNLVTRGLALVSAPILLAAHPFLMRAWGDGDARAASKWLSKIAEWFCTLGVILVAGMMLFAKDAAGLLLGPEFRQGYFVMPIVFAGELVWQLAMYTHKPLEFHNKTGLMFGLGVSAALLNVLLNCFLIPVYGYAAAAWSTLACYCVYTLITIYLGQRYLSWGIAWRRLLTTAGLAVVVVFLISVLRPVLDRSFGYGPALVVCILMALAVAGVIIAKLAKSLLTAAGSEG